MALSSLVGARFIAPNVRGWNIFFLPTGRHKWRPHSPHLKFAFLLIFYWFFSNTGLAKEPVKVSFRTQEGIKLTGLYSPAKKGHPTVIMLHGLSSSKEEWKPLMLELEKIQWGYLAYDARGHGESSVKKGADGEPVGYRYFGPPKRGSPWERMINDLGAAVYFLTHERSGDPNRIYVAGASLGANVTLNYAALTGKPAGIILLSPGLDYRGVKTGSAIKKVGKLAVLIVAHPNDHYSFESSQKLKATNPNVTFWHDVKPGHGVQMFDASLLTKIMAWLQKTASP